MRLQLESVAGHLAGRPGDRDIDLPGARLASAMSSLMLLPGKLGCATSTKLLKMIH